MCLDAEVVSVMVTVVASAGAPVTCGRRAGGLETYFCRLRCCCCCCCWCRLAEHVECALQDCEEGQLDGADAGHVLVDRDTGQVEDD